jgi:ribonuclease Z
MTRVEITFLGTSAAIPTPKRSHAAIYFRYIGKAEYVMLFDCGEGTQRQIFRCGENFMRISKIFITHWHADHFAGLLGLIESMSLEKRRDTLEIYGPEANRFVPMILNLGYGTRSFSVTSYDVPFQGNDINILVDEKEYQILSTPVRHGIPAVSYCFLEKDRIKIDKDKASKLGLPKQGKIYKILKEKGYVVYKDLEIKLEDVCYVEKGKKIVYSGDTKSCRNLIKISKNADLLILDCTYFDDLEERNHMNLEQAIDIAKKSDVKKIILTHISRRYQDEKELERIVNEYRNELDIKIARDFMKVVLE